MSSRRGDLDCPTAALLASDVAEIEGRGRPGPMPRAHDGRRGGARPPPGRGGRVVYEMDRRMPGSRSSNARTRLVLPPPEGAASTNRQPEAGGALVAMTVGWVILSSYPYFVTSVVRSQSSPRKRGSSDVQHKTLGPRLRGDDNG